MCTASSDRQCLWLQYLSNITPSTSWLTIDSGASAAGGYKWAWSGGYKWGRGQEGTNGRGQ